MDVYNTAVMVVACLEAADEEAAIGTLSGSLIDHGFDTITEPGVGPVAYASAFVAEDGTKPDTLPAPGVRIHGDYDPLPAVLGPLASQFTADEIEALLITAGDLWASADTTDNLSHRQKQLAERIWNLMCARMGG
jgi:hypothetical protein